MEAVKETLSKDQLEAIEDFSIEEYEKNRSTFKRTERIVWNFWCRWYKSSIRYCYWISALMRQAWRNTYCYERTWTHRRKIILYNEMKGGMYDDYINNFSSYFIGSDSGWNSTAFSRRYFITVHFRRCYSGWIDNLCYHQTHLEKTSQKLGGAT